jgi:predicted Zn-dependent peptidase
LDRARARRLAELNQDPNQPSYLATLWLDAETYKLRELNPAGEVSRVTSADIQRVAAHLFQDTPRAKVVVGQVAELKSQLGTNVEIPSESPNLKSSPPPAIPARRP